MFAASFERSFAAAQADYENDYPGRDAERAAARRRARHGAGCDCDDCDPPRCGECGQLPDECDCEVAS